MSGSFMKLFNYISGANTEKAKVRARGEAGGRGVFWQAALQRAATQRRGSWAAPAATP
jgi:hypothetical protein